MTDKQDKQGWSQIWTEGYCDSMVCLDVHRHTSGIITVGVDTERITQKQMEKALRREFPELTFTIRKNSEYMLAQAAAPATEEEESDVI